MSRRPVSLLALSLLTLSLAACSDVTAPTTSNQLRPAAQASANRCVGGSLSSDSRC
jgi:hypothetical protein